jgi:hypothetical protein
MVSSVDSQVQAANTQFLEAASSSSGQQVSGLGEDIPIFEVECQSAHKITRQITQAKASVEFLQHQRRAESLAALTAANAAKNSDIENWKWTHLPPISSQLSRAVDRLNACKDALQAAHST